ncbi:hypothetical protein AALA98_13930 [Lachnospiraceae bacterium 45-W7]
MGKRERKVETIKKYLDGAAGAWPAYVYGNIPKKLAVAACSSYAGAIQPGDILGLIDITVLGNGKKGMVFTENTIYYNNGALANKGTVSYRKIYESGKIPGDVLDSTYNSTAMRELVSKMSHIEGEDTVKEIGNAVDAGLGLVEKFAGKDTAKEIGDVVGAGAELVGIFAELFGGGKNK